MSGELATPTEENLISSSEGTCTCIHKHGHCEVVRPIITCVCVCA